MSVYKRVLMIIIGDYLYALSRLLRRTNSARATIWSFFIITGLGALIIYWSEQDRPVVSPHYRPAAKTELILPPSSLEFKQDQGESFIDALFISTSAVCVTGLISTDFSQFSLTGKITVLLLIQMGGLGIILATSFFAYLFAANLSRRLALNDLLSRVLDADSKYLERMIKHIFLYTVVIELSGFLILGAYLSLAKIELVGIHPWWWAAFHAISAFNNAGFSLMGNNLMSFAADPVICITLMILIVLGGLGYPVLIACHAAFSRKLRGNGRKLAVDLARVQCSSVQTRIAFVGSIMLILIGTMAILLMSDLHGSLGKRLLVSAFHSVSARTAGFNTIELSYLSTAALFVIMVLMFIGANPGGTAGGIKITTVAVLWGYIKNTLREPWQHVILLQRKVERTSVAYSIRLLFFSMMFITAIIFLICFFESKNLANINAEFNFLKIVFEVFSAFGTVGLSLGFSGGNLSFAAILTPVSKILLIFTMLFGRLGALTILSAIPWWKRETPAGTPERVAIG